MKPEQLPQRISEGTNMYTTLIRRAMENPKRAGMLPRFLETLPAQFWPGVVRAALEIPDQANEKAYGMVDAAMASALRAGSRPEIVAEIYNVLPRETVALQETALEVARQSVAIMENTGRQEMYPVGYLELLNNHTGRLLQAGRIGDAEREGRKAVEFAADPKYSGLPGISPARAAAYENQSHIMREIQRASEALALLDMAREVYEDLSSQQPEFKRSLAICLSNHMAILTAMKRPEEAVRYGRRAALMFREMLAGGVRTGGEFVTQGLQASIDNGWPNFAICLTALAPPLNEIKEYQESLAVATEAVSILSQIVHEAPDLHHLLGQAHANLAMALSALERFEEAERAVSSAVETYRRLDRLRPGVYVYYLAHCLRRQSFILARLDRLREALAPTRESLRLYKKLEKERPRVYAAELNGAQEQLEIISAELRKALPASFHRRRGKAH